MRRSRLWIFAGAAALVVILIVAAVASRSSKNTKHSSRVYMFGDSLIVQSSPYWLQMMQKNGFTAEQNSFAGTNTCDWFGRMTNVRDSFHPNVVVISFGGNTLTPCMQDANHKGLTGAAFQAKFAADTEKAVSLFPPSTHIYLVEPPAMYNGDHRFAAAYKAAAAKHNNVTFVDGGSILTPDRVWHQTLPCYPHETCTGPVVNGTHTAIVRSADKIHFCPVTPQANEVCPVYDPGAYRYALTIFNAIRHEP
jgi:hypothetical protein